MLGVLRVRFGLRGCCSVGLFYLVWFDCGSRVCGCVDLGGLGLRLVVS